MINIGRNASAFLLTMTVTLGGILSGCGYEGIWLKEKQSLPEGAIKLEASIEEVYGSADAIVTVISDDGIYDSCVNLDRIFGERNLRCTVAGVVGFVEPHQ